jgi:AAA15 family ATPase/GTPase
MYNKIIVDGLRGIKHIEIDDFKKINLFVGNNNSGKTTILESIFLLINPSNAELPLKINRFRGYDLIEENYWRTIFNKLDINSKIEIYAELDNIKENRRLIISPRSEIIDLQKASSMNGESFKSIDSYSGASPSINGLNMNFTIIKNRKSRKYLSKVYAVGSSVKVDIPKEYQEALTGIYVGSEINFIEIARIFSKVQIRKRIPKIIKVLKRIEPSLEGLSIGLDGIIYCDIGLDRLIPINVMGGGILRILHIVLAISDTQGGVVLVDEIENGLHYSSQKILWDAIFESALEFDAQIFATTHSLECINAFSSSYANSKLSEGNDKIRLFRLERRDDDISVISYNDKILAASLDSDWEVR